MSLIRISESNDWFVDYDKERGMYRVSYFEDNHFKDEFWFDCYEERELNNKVEKIIEKLETLKILFKEKMTKQRLYCSSSNLEFLFNRLIAWIREL